MFKIIILTVYKTSGSPGGSNIKIVGWNFFWVISMIFLPKITTSKNQKSHMCCSEVRLSEAGAWVVLNSFWSNMRLAVLIKVVLIKKRV